MKKWDIIANDDKINFIIYHLDIDASIETVREYVIKNILVNDLADKWFDPQDIVKGKKWNSLTEKEKNYIVFDEIDNDWNKESLIEFLVDHMSAQDIEKFKQNYI